MADAKSDGVISKVEEKELNRLIEMLQVRPKFKEYLRGEIGMLRQRQKILEGNLPSIPQPPELEIKAGELIHASCDGLLLVTRKLKSGPVVDEHRGTLTVLDSRAIFQSPEFSKAISYRRLVSCSGKEWCLEFQLDGKPQWSFTIHDVQPLFHLIFTQAIKMANQTAVRKNTSGPSRHISRDVRQRVWQRYGGQCAECGRADYLEFDHIIPVAKGGSNGDSNIQLLCRRCNLKKSDHI